MTSRDVKFVMRIIVMMMMALVAALGARIALESAKFEKVVGRTPLRDMLILFAPIASLAIVHYTLALKSYGIRSLQTEGLTFLAVVCAFLAITLPYHFGSQVPVSISECAWWKLWGCSADEVKFNYWLLSVIAVVGVVALAHVLRREKVMR